MADDDDKKTETKFKTWINEVMDERETKAAADRKKAEDDAAEEAKKNQKPSLMQTLFGG